MKTECVVRKVHGERFVYELEVKAVAILCTRDGKDVWEVCALCAKVANEERRE